VRRFVFLDRDGTLVRDVGYVYRLEDYALLPGVAEGLRRLSAAGWALAIVTNQSGIGRGYYAESDFHAFQERLVGDLRSRGVVIERSLFCPHRPDDGCACRKPEPGLLLRARDELDADLGRSWMIGDEAKDAEAAARAGCRGTVLVGERATGVLPPGAVRAPDLPAAAAHVLERDVAAT
jgi:D-glycero-D-manno-heptose 1,7-bisphosphate phosphatase